MPSCAVKWCKNNSTLRKKSDGITFHSIPKEDERRTAWIEVLRRSRFQESWNPSESTLICSKHFEESEFYTTPNGLRRLSKSAIPKKDLYHPSFNIKNIIVERAPSFETVKLVTSENEEHLTDITIKTEPTEKVIIERTEVEDPLPDTKEQLIVYTEPLKETKTQTSALISSTVSKKKQKYGKGPSCMSKNLVHEQTIRHLREELKKMQSKLKIKDGKIKLLNQTVRRLTRKVEKLREKLNNVKPENYVDISQFIQ